MKFKLCKHLNLCNEHSRRTKLSISRYMCKTKRSWNIEPVVGERITQVWSSNILSYRYCCWTVTQALKFLRVETSYIQTIYFTISAYSICAKDLLTRQVGATNGLPRGRTYGKETNSLSDVRGKICCSTLT